MEARQRTLAFRASLRAAQASKHQRRAGRKHVLPTSFYGNGGTKFIGIEALYHVVF